MKGIHYLILATTFASPISALPMPSEAAARHNIFPETLATNPDFPLSESGNDRTSRHTKTLTTFSISSLYRSRCLCLQVSKGLNMGLDRPQYLIQIFSGTSRIPAHPRTATLIKRMKWLPAVEALTQALEIVREVIVKTASSIPRIILKPIAAFRVRLARIQPISVVNS